MDDSSNSLDGWVVFRPGAFSSTDGTNTKFHVAWNLANKEFAITARRQERTASDLFANTDATSCSVQKIQGIYRDVTLVGLYPSLKELFPQQVLDVASGSFWTSSQVNFDEETCRQLETFFGETVQRFGFTLIHKILFSDDSFSDFEEDVQELRLRARDNAVESAKKELDNIIRRRSEAKNMIQTSVLWALEEDKLDKLFVALAEKYTFQAVPFLKLRELITDKKNVLVKVMKDPNLGKKRKDEALQKARELHDQYLATSSALHQLYQEYYRINADIPKERLKRLQDDKQKFGDRSFEVEGGLDRLRCTEISFLEHQISFLGVIKVSQEFQRSLIKQEIKSGRQKDDLKLLEAEYIEAHSRVLDTALDILNESEKLVKIKLDHEKMKQEELEQNTFYDAREDQNSPASINPELERVIQKQGKLKEELDWIRGKRASLRNKITLVKQRQSNLPKIDSKNKRKPITTREEARKAAIARVKEYRKLHPKSTDNEELPPPPPNYSDVLADPLPPPPEFVLEQEKIEKPIPQNLNKISTVHISSAPLAPPPPPPPLPPITQTKSPNIPPPPPPPPPSLFSGASSPIRKAHVESLPKSKPPEPKSLSSGIDLKEILQRKNSLRKAPAIPSTESKARTMQANNPLLATLQRIREVTAESDDSHSTDEENSFDD